MHYKISYEHIPHYVLVKIDNDSGPRQIEAIIDNIIDGESWGKGTGIIIDYSKINLKCFSVSDIDYYCKIAFKHRNRLSNSLCAIIVNESIDFTIFNIFETLADSKSNHKVRIFYNLDDAQEWIKSFKTVKPCSNR